MKFVYLVYQSPTAYATVCCSFAGSTCGNMSLTSTSLYPPLSKLFIGLSPYFSNIALSSSQPLHSVVNIFSPVKIAFAPALKHRICSASLMVVLPAAIRMMVAGITTRAVAMVLRMASKLMRFRFGSSPSGVPLIGTRALTGKDSG